MKPEVRKIKQEAQAKGVRKRLKNIPGVNATAIGYKYVDGEPTDELSIHAFVAEKVPEDELKQSEVIPQEVKGVTVDVLESDPDNIVYEGGNNSEGPARDDRQRPIMAGLRAESDGGDLATISPGVLNSSGRESVIVAFHHVNNIGSALYQPNLDTNQADNNRIGESVSGDYDEGDWALVELDDEADFTNEILGMPPYKSLGDEPSPGVRFTVTGENAGMLGGTVTSIDYDQTERLDYVYEPDENIDTSGVSGAPVSWRDDSGEEHIVGMHVARDNERRFVSSYRKIKERGQFTFDTGSYSKPTDSTAAYFTIVMRYVNSQTRDAIVRVVNEGGSSGTKTVTIEEERSNGNVIDSRSISLDGFAFKDYKVSLSGDNTFVLSTPDVTWTTPTLLDQNANIRGFVCAGLQGGVYEVNNGSTRLIEQYPSGIKMAAVSYHPGIETYAESRYDDPLNNSFVTEYGKGDGRQYPFQDAFNRLDVSETKGKVAWGGTGGLHGQKTIGDDGQDWANNQSGAASGVKYTPSGDFVWVAEDGNGILKKLDTTDGSTAVSYDIGTDVEGFYPDPDSNNPEEIGFLLDDGGPDVEYVDLSGGSKSVIWSIRPSDGVEYLAQGTDHWYLLGNNATVKQFDKGVSSPSPNFTKSYSSMSDFGQTVCAHPDGRFAVATFESGSDVYEYDSAGNILNTYDLTGGSGIVAVSSAGGSYPSFVGVYRNTPQAPTELEGEVI